MEHDCLTTFSIKQLYIWLEVVKIFFYHCAHTRENGEPAHGQNDPIFMAYMSQYAPQTSQALKDRVGGHRSMQEKLWHMMILLNNNILHVWI
jgi:hypothetical protein